MCARKIIARGMWVGQSLCSLVRGECWPTILDDDAEDSVRKVQRQHEATIRECDGTMAEIEAAMTELLNEYNSTVTTMADKLRIEAQLIALRDTHKEAEERRNVTMNLHSQLTAMQRTLQTAEQSKKTMDVQKRMVAQTRHALGGVTADDLLRDQVELRMEREQFDDLSKMITPAQPSRSTRLQVPASALTGGSEGADIISEVQRLVGNVRSLPPPTTIHSSPYALPPSTLPMPEPSPGPIQLPSS